MIDETGSNFPKSAHEMLATYLNIVAKSQDSDWRYKVISKKEFEKSLKETKQSS